MGASRITFLTVLALAVLPASDSLTDKVCAQTPVTVQETQPGGGITTVSTRPGDSVTIQNITPQGMVITQSILSDGTVITQNILPDGTVLSDDMRPGDGRTGSRNVGPPTLKSGLDVSAWDPGQRGPLLAVAPEAVLPVWQTAGRKPQIGRDGTPLSFAFTPPRSPERLPDHRYRAADLAAYFGQRIVRLRGLSVLAPIDMTVLHTKPGTPDYFADLSRNEKLQMLHASLSAAQWKLLGSERGLGANDLSGSQRELFISSLPNPVVISKPLVYEPNSGAKTASLNSKPIILSASQRRNIRLRLNRAVGQFGVAAQGGGSAFYMSGDSAPEFACLDYSGFGDAVGSVFGQRIFSIVPSRLKPQQIDFDAPSLHKPISLSGLKTVGELVERVRTTTRTEIYVDKRVANRTLWAKTADSQTVRAGDALQALCWSLTGAVRYVSDPDGLGGVFILTEDLDGIGSRMARLKDWAQAAQEHARQAQSALQDKIRTQQPMQYIGFVANDSNALGEKANKAVEDTWKTPQGRWKSASVSLTDLSPQQQESIHQRIAAFEKSGTDPDGDNRKPVKNGLVSVSVHLRATLIVPGVGEVREANAFIPARILDAMLPLAIPTGPVTANTAPEPADTRDNTADLALSSILCVSPTTPEQARQVVQSAQKRGLRQVWIVLPLVPAAASDKAAFAAESQAILTAAIGEAKKSPNPLKIAAGVRLFRLASSRVLEPRTQTETVLRREEQDVTITGELPSEVSKRRLAIYVAAQPDSVPAPLTPDPTSDWVVPGTAGGAERIIRRVSAVAAVPGVAGIVLLDASPPGYGTPDGITKDRERDSLVSVGYTTASRVAFIRSAGIDPIDITKDRFVTDLEVSLPFLDSGRFAIPQSTGADRNIGEWNRFRTVVVSKVLADLYTPLMASLPGSAGGFPVFMQNLDAYSGGSGWFSRWERKDVLPRRSSTEVGQPQKTYQAAKRVSDDSFLEVTYKDPVPVFRSASTSNVPDPEAPSAQYMRQLNSLLTENRGAWAGLILNFSDITVEKALEQIERLAPAGAAPSRPMKKQ